MECPNCESENWLYTGETPEVHKLDDSGFIVQLDFECYCIDCKRIFYRREEFEYTGTSTMEIVKESE